MEQAKFKAREFKRSEYGGDAAYSDNSSVMHLSAAKRTPKAVT